VLLHLKMKSVPVKQHLLEVQEPVPATPLQSAATKKERHPEIVRQASECAVCLLTLPQPLLQ